MLLPLGVSLNYVLLDASLALTAFFVGILGSHFFYGNRPKNTEPQPSAGTAANPYEAERNAMAVQQLKDLTTNVASDVGAHSQFVSEISDQLGELDKTSVDKDELIAEALRQIMEANSKLQSRLEDAENKIKAQAEELMVTQTQAQQDSLTSLANRGAFDQALARGIEDFRQHGRPLSLLLFDVDHFKNFNDSHGHQAGDEILRRVAATLKMNSKSSDLACRYGGEEFALVMPNTTIKKAVMAAERIRNAIAKMNVDYEGKSLNVTASMGVAESLKLDDAASMIRRSDEAIYCAKGSGRNCSYWHDGEGCLSVEELNGAYSSPSTRNEAVNLPHASLPDRIVFAAELQRRISESHRTGADLSIIYLKVIGYTALERDYGEAVTELVLDSVGQFVASKLREMDLLGRLERGEFIIMLPGSSKREATIVGNRVRSALAGCPIPLGTKQLTLQLTQAATSVAPEDTSEEMIDRIVKDKSVEQKPVAVG